MRVGRKNPKNVWWNVVKAAAERKEAAWKEVLRVRDEGSKDRCMEVFKEIKRKVKSVFIREKRR